MEKRIISILLIIVSVSLLLCGSCTISGERNMSLEERADAKTEQIVSAIINGDKEGLKTLFSKKALDEVDDIDNEMDYLFDFIQGDIDSYERESGVAADISNNGGKKSQLIRFSFEINTDVDTYGFFIFDYIVDTINPDNEGVYMIEVTKSSYSGKYKGWQERIRAGVDVLED